VIFRFVGSSIVRGRKQHLLPRVIVRRTIGAHDPASLIYSFPKHARVAVIRAFVDGSAEWSADRLSHGFGISCQRAFAGG